MTFFLFAILIMLLILLSAFFAGTETGIYRISRFRILVGCEKGKSLYKMLARVLQDGQGLILSLLLGNNLVNNLLASLVTFMFLQTMTDQYWAGIYATLILTPVLFIFGEIVPKNVFYHRADTLVPAMAWLNWFFYRLFTLSGAVWGLKGGCRLLSLVFRLKVDTAQAVDASRRHRVHQIIHETREEGLLSRTQKEMMSRLIDIPDRPVAEAMVKLRDVEMVGVDTDRDGLLRCLQTTCFTCLPVYRQSRNHILGYIHIYQVLGKMAPFLSLENELTDLPEIGRNTSIMEAINLLRSQRQRIALVVESGKKRKRPVGMITISDLVEELTGELNG